MELILQKSLQISGSLFRVLKYYKNREENGRFLDIETMAKYRSYCNVQFYYILISLGREISLCFYNYMSLFLWNVYEKMEFNIELERERESDSISNMSREDLTTRLIRVSVSFTELIWDIFWFWTLVWSNLSHVYTRRYIYTLFRVSNSMVTNEFTRFIVFNLLK